MRKVNSSLQKLLLKIAGEKYRDFVLIQLEWENTVGSIMANASKVTKFEKRTLYVKVAHHGWVNEFVLIRPDIIEKLQKNTGLKIDNILFSI